jgi:hypothetical protein
MIILPLLYPPPASSPLIVKLVSATIHKTGMRKIESVARQRQAQKVKEDLLETTLILLKI